jgi:hypothetical protein
MEVQLEGWLEKKGHLIKNWKKRYVVLTRANLRYFVDNSQTQLKGTIPLDHTTRVLVRDGRSHAWKFAVETGAEKFLELAAENVEARTYWVNTLNVLIGRDSFYPDTFADVPRGMSGAFTTSKVPRPIHHESRAISHRTISRSKSTPDRNNAQINLLAVETETQFIEESPIPPPTEQDPKSNSSPRSNPSSSPFADHSKDIFRADSPRDHLSSNPNNSDTLQLTDTTTLSSPPLSSPLPSPSSSLLIEHIPSTSSLPPPAFFDMGGLDLSDLPDLQDLM